MKNIIITSGPTNERIDAVMKITNMSTGALGSIITDTILSSYESEIENIFYISPKLAYKPKVKSDKLKLITIDSAEDLINILQTLLKEYSIDAIVHSSAVGDYKGKYVVRAEDLVEEILNSNLQDFTQDEQRKILLNIFENPSCICNDKTKISSYEKNLMVKLDLTPKVISTIKALSPTTMLIGFKLLEGVSEDELYNVAHKLLIKNDADYIIANLLNRIGNGKHFAMILNKDGILTRCETKKEIADNVSSIIFK